MLRIYPVSIDMLRQVRRAAEQIARHDKNHASPLKDSALSVTLNLAEGSGSRAGTRRARYDTALGSARETMANLEAAEAIGYIEKLEPGLRGKLDHIIGTLVKVLH